MYSEWVELVTLMLSCVSLTSRRGSIIWKETGCSLRRLHLFVIHEHWFGAGKPRIVRRAITGFWHAKGTKLHEVQQRSFWINEQWLLYQLNTLFKRKTFNIYIFVQWCSTGIRNDKRFIHKYISWSLLALNITLEQQGQVKCMRVFGSLCNASLSNIPAKLRLSVIVWNWTSLYEKRLTSKVYNHTQPTDLPNLTTRTIKSPSIRIGAPVLTRSPKLKQPSLWTSTVKPSMW